MLFGSGLILLRRCWNSLGRATIPPQVEGVIRAFRTLRQLFRGSKADRKEIKGYVKNITMPNYSWSREVVTRNMETPAVNLSTTTPILTRGLERSPIALRASGLMGSLRWWFEALMRGWGIEVCDPTTHHCPDKEGNYCSACFVYGATGWRRSFALRLTELDEPVQLPAEPLFLPSGRKHGPKLRPGGWHLPPGWMGRFRLEVRPLHRDRFVPAAVLLPLRIVERWAGLGAKTQLGYGVVQGSNEDTWWSPAVASALEEELERLQQLPERDRVNPSTACKDPDDDPCPDLKDFFFGHFTFTASDSQWWTRLNIYELAKKDGKGNEKLVDHMVRRWGLVPISPEVRNYWRYNGGSPLKLDVLAKNELFGYIRPTRRRSRISVSWAYRGQEENQWRIRIWGWIPRQRSYRDQVIQAIYNIKDSRDLFGMAGLGKVQRTKWREFGPDRCGETDYNAFVQGLLKG